MEHHPPLAPATPLPSDLARECEARQAEAPCIAQKLAREGCGGAIALTGAGVDARGDQVAKSVLDLSGERSQAERTQEHLRACFHRCHPFLRSVPSIPVKGGMNAPC